MMLQINHRESHDVDIFLDDAQYLSFLDPQKQDLNFELAPSAYGGDGAHFLKIVFGEMGEIDFIVASSRTQRPTIEQKIEGVMTLLETVPEVIAKKITYRGSHIQPRDIFDIAAAAESRENDVKAALQPFKADVAVALATIQKLNPKFVRDSIATLQIQDGYKGLVDQTLERAVYFLRDRLRMG